MHANLRPLSKILSMQGHKKPEALLSYQETSQASGVQPSGLTSGPQITIAYDPCTRKRVDSRWCTIPRAWDRLGPAGPWSTLGCERGNRRDENEATSRSISYQVTKSPSASPTHWHSGTGALSGVLVLPCMVSVDLLVSAWPGSLALRQCIQARAQCASRSIVGWR